VVLKFREMLEFLEMLDLTLDFLAKLGFLLTLK
jgi:hypothetical protein